MYSSCLRFQDNSTVGHNPKLFHFDDIGFLAATLPWSILFASAEIGQVTPVLHLARPKGQPFCGCIDIILHHGPLNSFRSRLGPKISSSKNEKLSNRGGEGYRFVGCLELQLLHLVPVHVRKPQHSSPEKQREF